MRRRRFLAVLGAGAAFASKALRSQPAAMPLVGFLNPRSPERAASVVAAFRQGLHDTGFVEGQNVAVEYRWAHDRSERLPELAEDLVRRSVAVIVASAASSARAAMKATASIPIVFTTAVDPVRLGLVQSLSRPEGNVTGVTFYSGNLIGKQLELLHEVAPQTSAVAIIVNPAAPAAEPSIKDAQVAASALGMMLHVVETRSERELENAFRMVRERNADAFMVAVDPLFDSRPELVAALAARAAVPGIYYAREFVLAGGLLSYGASLTDAYRTAGVYAGRILKGAKPAELPVTQPSNFELVVNLATAKALGLAIPPAILARADEAIE